MGDGLGYMLAKKAYGLSSVKFTICLSVFGSILASCAFTLASDFASAKSIDVEQPLETDIGLIDDLLTLSCLKLLCISRLIQGICNGTV